MKVKYFMILKIYLVITVDKSTLTKPFLYCNLCGLRWPLQNICLLISFHIYIYYWKMSKMKSRVPFFKRSHFFKRALKNCTEETQFPNILMISYNHLDLPYFLKFYVFFLIYLLYFQNFSILRKVTFAT